jgi:hypothetical protein
MRSYDCIGDAHYLHLLENYNYGPAIVYNYQRQALKDCVDFVEKFLLATEIA